MAIFLTDISAFQLWFCDQPSIREVRTLETAVDFKNATCAAKGVPRDQLARLGLRGQLHLAVPSHAKLRMSRGIVGHVFTDPPPHSFVRIGPDIYVEAPIPTLVKLAPRLPKGKVMKLIYQLLGTYQLKDDHLAERKPLATLEQLRAYIASARRMRGLSIVRPLLRFAVEGIASPEEARVAALLFLPARLGGKGLPIPDANRKVETPESQLPIVRVADYYWHRWRLILEYDSDAHHSGTEKLGLDNVRRTQLQTSGYTVVTLTRRQLHRAKEFEDVVAALLRAMGKTPERSVRGGFSGKETELRDALYGLDVEQALGI